MAVPAIKEWAKQYGITNVVSNPSILINDPNIDAILICSPTNTHADLIIEAAAEKAGVKLQLGFNRRFNPNFKGSGSWYRLPN